MNSIQKLIFLIAVAFPYAATAQETEDPGSYEAVMDMLNSDDIYFYRAVGDHGTKANLLYSPYSCAHAIKNAQVSDAERQELWALFLYRNCATALITYSLLGNPNVKKLFTPSTLAADTLDSLGTTSFFRKALKYLVSGGVGALIGVSPIGQAIDKAFHGRNARPKLSTLVGGVFGLAFQVALNARSLERNAQQIPALEALVTYYFGIIKSLSNILPANLVAEAEALKLQLEAHKFYIKDKPGLSSLIDQHDGAFFGFKKNLRVINEYGHQHMEVDWNDIKEKFKLLRAAIDSEKLEAYVSALETYYENLSKQAGLA